MWASCHKRNSAVYSVKERSYKAHEIFTFEFLFIARNLPVSCQAIAMKNLGSLRIGRRISIFFLFPFFFERKILQWLIFIVFQFYFTILLTVSSRNLSVSISLYWKRRIFENWPGNFNFFFLESKDFWTIDFYSFSCLFRDFINRKFVYTKTRCIVEEICYKNDDSKKQVVRTISVTTG